jgi:uncharacterized protein
MVNRALTLATPKSAFDESGNGLSWMPRDELRQPLRKRSTMERLWSRRPGALAAISVLTLAAYGGAAVWLMRHPIPYAGEPVVVAAIPPVEVMQTGAIDKVSDAGAGPAADPLADDGQAQADVDADPDPGPPPDDVPAIQITGQEPEIVVSRQRPLRAAPFSAVTEQSPQGPLPKMGNGGKRPADVYAQVTPMGVMVSDRPKIALLLGGMGLNAKLTQKAIETLPGDVTFGFAPYGNDLQTLANLARNRGHEVMLQLPLEPMGYPAVNPGPNTLTGDAGDAANLDALRWNMSRFAGYTGLTNYMGAKFLTEAEGLRPILAEMKKRGLLFLQDATVTVSATDQAAGETGLAVRHAEVVIDANPDPDSIAAALKDLENRARNQGIAIGTGTGLDVTIDAVNDWAITLEKRGFVLVPVSAAYKGRRS